MKKQFTLSAIILSTVMLGGCALPIPQLPEMTEEQEGLVTEYAAGLLLKYSPTYENQVLSDEQLAEAEAKEAVERAREEHTKQLAEEYLAKAETKKKNDEAKGKDKNKSGESEPKAPDEEVVGDLADFYGMTDFDITCQGYEVTKSYSDGGFMSIEADAGKDLCVVSFDITNTSSDAVECDFFDMGLKFNAKVNDGKKVNNEATLLLDDLAMYKDTIDSQSSVHTVLLFQIPEETQVETLNIYMKNGDRKGIITL